MKHLDAREGPPSITVLGMAASHARTLVTMRTAAPIASLRTCPVTPAPTLPCIIPVMARRCTAATAVVAVLIVATWGPSALATGPGKPGGVG